MHKPTGEKKNHTLENCLAPTPHQKNFFIGPVYLPVVILFPKSTGNPHSLSPRNINVLLFTCVPVSFFESFRRDLNEAKAVYVSCNAVNYHPSPVNISLLPLCNYDSPITSQVSSNVVNRPLCLIQIPSKRLKYDKGK